MTLTHAADASGVLSGSVAMKQVLVPVSQWPKVARTVVIRFESSENRCNTEWDSETALDSRAYGR